MSISEDVKKVYNLLIDDPDYQDTPTKSREEVVLQEAVQRVKQNRRNNIALSLSKNTNGSSNGHAVSSLTDFILDESFLQKAKRPDVIKARREQLLTLKNPKQASLDLLVGLMPTGAEGMPVSVLTENTREIGTILPHYMMDLEDILEGEGKRDVFDIDTVKENIGRLDALLNAEAKIQRLNIRDEEEFNDALITHLSSVNGPLSLTDDGAAVRFVDSFLAQARDNNSSIYDEIQTMRGNLAEEIHESITKSPTLRKGRMVVDEVDDPDHEISFIDAQKEYPDLELTQKEDGEFSRPVVGGWQDNLGPEVFVKYQFEAREMLEGTMVDPDTHERVVARASENLITKEVAEGMGNWVSNMGGLDAIANQDDGMGQRTILSLRRSGAGGQVLLNLIADSAKARGANQADRLFFLKLQNDSSERVKKSAVYKYADASRALFKKAKAERDGDVEPSGEFTPEYIRYLAGAVLATDTSGNYLDIDGKPIEIENFIRDDEGNLKDPDSIVHEGGRRKNKKGHVIEGDLKVRERLDASYYQSVDRDAPVGVLSSPIENPDWALQEYRDVSANFDGYGSSSPTEGETTEHPLDVLRRTGKLGRAADSLDDRPYREDFGKASHKGWLGQDRERLIENINNMYAIDGVSEVFLYGESVKDLTKNPEKKENAQIYLGVRVRPDMDANKIEKRVTQYLDSDINTKYFSASSYNTDDYKEFGETISCYGEEFPKAAEALYRELPELLRTNVAGGGRPSSPPLTMSENTLGVDVDGKPVDLSRLWDKIEGERLAVEDDTMVIPPDIAYQWANQNSEIRNLRKQEALLRGEDAPPVKFLSDQIFQLEHFQKSLFPQLSKLEDADRELVWNQILELLYPDAAVRPANRHELLASTSEDGQPIIPTLFHTLRRGSKPPVPLRKPDAEPEPDYPYTKIRQAAEGDLRASAEEYFRKRYLEERRKNPLGMYATAFQKDVKLLFGNKEFQREKLGYALSDIPKTATAAKRWLRGTIEGDEGKRRPQFPVRAYSTLNPSLRQLLMTHYMPDAPPPSVEPVEKKIYSKERRALRDAAMGQGDIFELNEAVRTDELDPETGEVREKGVDISSLHPIVQSLIDDDGVLRLNVKRPGLKNYQEIIHMATDALTDNMVNRTFKNVRKNLVYYDGKGKVIVLAAAMPNFTNIVDVEDNPEQAEEVTWDIHPVKLMAKAYADKGGYINPKSGKYLNEKGRRTAELKREDILQELVNAAPEDEQQILEASGLVAIPDLGQWDAIRDARTNEPMTGKPSFDTPKLFKILKEMGLNPDELSIFYMSTSPLISSDTNDTTSTYGTGLEAALNFVKDSNNLKDGLNLGDYHPNKKRVGPGIREDEVIIDPKTKEVLEVREGAKKVGDVAVTPNQQSIRDSIGTLSIAARDSLVALWQNIGETPSEITAEGLVLPINGRGTAERLAADLIRKVRAYHKGQISRDELISRPPQTRKETQEWERRIGEFQQHGLGRVLPFDIENDEFHAILLHLVAERIADDDWIQMMADDETIEDSPAEIKANFEKAQQWPSRTIIDENGQEVEIPTIDAKNLDRIRTAVNSIYERLDPELEEALAYSVGHGRLGYDPAMEQAYNTAIWGDASGDKKAKKAIAANIRGLSDAQGLRAVQTGMMELSPDYFQENALEHFQSKFYAFKALAESLDYDSIEEMFVKEHILVPHPPQYLRAAPAAETMEDQAEEAAAVEGMDLEAMPRQEYQLTSRSGRTPKYIPIDAGTLQSFLQKTMSNSRKGDSHEDARHPFHKIDSNLQISRVSDEEPTEITGAGQHIHNPTFFSLRIFPDGSLGIQKIYDHGVQQDINNEPIRTAGGLLRPLLSVEKTKLKTSGLKPLGQILESGSGSYKLWSHESQTMGTIVEPTSSTIDFTAINELLTKYRIPVNFSTDVDPMDKESVANWIVDVKQKILLLTEMRGNIPDMEEEDKAFWDEHFVTNRLFPALNKALNHILIGNGEPAQGGMGKTAINFLYPHATPAARSARQNGHHIFNTTNASDIASTYSIQDNYESMMLDHISKALNNMPVEDLQKMFGKHINVSIKVDPAKMLLRDINKLKQRGREMAQDDPTFNYFKHVNNEVNLLLSDMYDLVGRYHSEVMHYWEDEPSGREPAAPIQNMEDLYINARKQLLKDSTDERELLLYDNLPEGLTDNIPESLRDAMPEGLSANAQNKWIAEVEDKWVDDTEEKWTEDVIAGRQVLGEDADIEFQGLQNEINRLNNIPLEDLVTGANIPEGIHSRMNDKIQGDIDAGRIRVDRNPNSPTFGQVFKFPQFFSKGSGLRYNFVSELDPKTGKSRRSPEEGNGPLALGIDGVSVPKLILDPEERFLSLTEGLGINGRGTVLESADIEEGTGSIPEHKEGHYYIKLERGGTPLGHLVRDNGTWSIWRKDDFEPPGTEGGGAPLQMQNGEDTKPIYEGITLREAKTKILRAIEWFDPNNPTSYTGIYHDPDDMSTASVVRRRAAVAVAQTAESVRDTEDADEAAEAAIPPIPTNLAGELKDKVPDNVIEELENSGASKNQARMILHPILKQDKAGWGNQLDIIDLNTIVPTETEGEEPLSIGQHIRKNAENNPDPASRQVTWLENKAIQRLENRWQRTINAADGKKGVENPDKALIHAAPLLQHFMTTEGHLNVDTLVDIDNKFVALGLHSMFDPDDPTGSRATVSENKYPKKGGEEREDYSGLYHVITRIQSLAQGIDVKTRGSEPNAEQGIAGNELRKDMYGVFEDLIKGYNVQESAEKWQEVNDLATVNAGTDADGKQAAITSDDKEEAQANQEQKPDQLPRFLQNLKTDEARQAAIQEMEKTRKITFGEGDDAKEFTLSPWKMSANGVKALAKSFGVLQDNVDEGITNGVLDENGKLKDAWDSRLYITDSEGNFNEDFVGLNRNGNLSADEKEAQISILKQFINEKGHINHHHNTDDEATQVIQAWTSQHFRNWDNALSDPTDFRSPFALKAGEGKGKVVDEDHPYARQLPRVIREEDITRVVKALDRGEFGAEGMREDNESWYEMGIKPYQERLAAASGEAEKTKTEWELREEKRIALNEAKRLKDAKEDKRLEAKRLKDEAKVVKEQTLEAQQEVKEAEEAAETARQTAESVQDTDEADAANNAVAEANKVLEAAQQKLADVTEKQTEEADDADKKVVETIGADGEGEATSAWDALSPDEQAALEEQYGGIDIATLSPAAQDALIAAASNGKKEPPTGGPVVTPTPEDNEEEQTRLSHLDTVMTVHFGDNWKEDIKTNKKISAIFDSFHHPKTGQKELDADYKKLYTDEIKREQAAERKAKLEGAATAGDVNKEKLESLKTEYREAYKRGTISLHNPNGTTLNEDNISNDPNTLQRDIDEWKRKGRVAEEAKEENVRRTKANDLKAFMPPEGIPQGLSARVVKQYARKALLHQGKYDTDLDSKGKSFMTDANKKILADFWEDISQRTDSQGKKLVDYEELKAEMGANNNVIQYKNKEGETVEGHAFEEVIDKEDAAMEQAEENHKALVEQLNTEGVEALKYPVNGHNILVSPDGKHEVEFGDGGEYTPHENGRRRDQLGNLIEPGGNRSAKAPSIFGLTDLSEEEREKFNIVWNGYYQAEHRVANLYKFMGLEPDGSSPIAEKMGYEIPEVISMTNQEAKEYPTLANLDIARRTTSGLERGERVRSLARTELNVAEVVKLRDDYKEQILKDYKSKGFKEEWLIAAQKSDQDTLHTDPETGEISIEEGEHPFGFPVNLEEPLPQVVDPETGELVDGWYSPSLHAVVNSRLLRTLFQENKKYNTNPLYGDHSRVRVFPADLRRKGVSESAGAGLEADDKRLQLIQPLPGSPLETTPAILATKEGGIYPVSSLETFSPAGDGPRSSEEVRQQALMVKIGDEMATNPLAFSGNVANLLGFSSHNEGSLDSAQWAGNQEDILSTPTGKKIIRNSPAARQEARLRQKESQASVTARFLASMGGYTRETAAEVPSGRIFMAVARDAAEKITGKRDLVPATQTQRHWEQYMANVKRTAEDTNAQAELASGLGLLEQKLPIDPKTGQRVEMGAQKDPFAHLRGTPEIESPSLGGAVGALRRFARQKPEPEAESSAPPPSLAS